MLKSVEASNHVVVPTTNTRERRSQQMLKLLARFTEGSMTSQDVGALLNCKTACAEKYLQQLRDEHMIVLDHYKGASMNSPGKPAWRLAADDERIRKFQEMIQQPKKRGSGRSEKPQVSASQGGSMLSLTIGANGQRIYMLADETHHAIRPNCDPVRRDPLVAALFGAAGATHEAQAA
ncbi:hypothetical protein V8J88_18185 [Massilia sp. W12]|uniref:hypothetical protein n=1 Tax=Massilia sp. W12 TaxID=3126507 RepID=UPI0030CD6311